jgi:hypothetical protein
VPCAYGWTSGGKYWIEVPRVATYGFRPGSGAVTASLFPAATEHVVEDAFRTSVLPLAWTILGREALHGSSIETDAGITAFCGMSGAGKSTIAFGLSLRGYGLWGDDALIFEAQDDPTVTAYPVPFALNLRPQSQSFFGSVPPSPRDEQREPEPLSSVVVLERVNAGPSVRIEQLALGEAIRELLPHGYRFTLDDPDRKRKTMESYLALASTVPVFKACFRPEFESLPMLLDQIERFVLRAERVGSEPAA